MQLSVQSERFVAELERRIAALGSSNPAATIVVPDEMSWWYIQEFGTADEYAIDPVVAKELLFPDPDNPDGERIHAKHVEHPPIRARHMVSSVIEDIHQKVQEDFAATVASSGFDGEEIRYTFLTGTMEDVKQIIADSFAERLPGTREDGRLLGESASEVFISDAEIRES